jgi:saccharopine dehydrogenase-like NADP-dependent oxidoreductase
MKNILVLGAGRSSSSLIKYLLELFEKTSSTITVGDQSENLAKEKTKNHPNSRCIQFTLEDQALKEKEIAGADVVISMLPPSMHTVVARECLKQKKHLITASYVSPEMAALHEDAKKSGLLFLNEAGLDPGIDHMSAMQIIDKIKASGGEITSFKSYTGGLIAPESDDNPWHYKFTWNPRNVILAGQGTAKYIEGGKYRYIPYNRLFKQTRIIEAEGLIFEGYANRDSLSYIDHYGLNKIKTMLRGTLRIAPFCRAWSVFVSLGLTDDSFIIDNSEKLSYADIVEALLPFSSKNELTLKEKLAIFCNEETTSVVMDMIEWTGILSDEKHGVKNASPAKILQTLLEQKLILKPDDKDMIVMHHEFIYQVNNENHKIYSLLVVKGEDTVHTAMSKTVGIPVGICARLLIENKIKDRGVLIPVNKEIYEPVLKELKNSGINFKEKEEQLTS